jgi:hypothetical protein
LVASEKQRCWHAVPTNVNGAVHVEHSLAAGPEQSSHEP